MSGRTPEVDPPATGGPGPDARRSSAGEARHDARLAAGLAGGWAILLAGLAALWVRSPFLGSGTAFVAWSPAAAICGVVTWRWLRSRKIPQIPLTPPILGTVLALWAAALTLAVSDVGPTVALDGLMLRRPWLERLGTVARWAPLVFGLALSLAALSAALEARYRLARRDGVNDL